MDTDTYVMRSEPTEKFQRISFHVDDYSQSVFLGLILLHRQLHPQVIHMVQTMKCDVFVVCIYVTCNNYVTWLIQNL